MKKTKKSLLAIVALSAVCALSGTAMGCNNCEHDSLKLISDTATCDKSGIATYSCNDCGEKVEKNSSAIGHDYSVFVSDSATCTGTGIKTTKCSRCDSTNTESSSAKGHKFSRAKCSSCDATNPIYEKTTVNYKSGTYTYRKTLKYVSGYTIYELSCGIELNSEDNTAEFFISGNLKMFTGKTFYSYICDDDDILLGSGGIMISPANSIYASKKITLTRKVEDGEICFFRISAPD